MITVVFVMITINFLLTSGAYTAKIIRLRLILIPSLDNTLYDPLHITLHSTYIELNTSNN